MGSGCNALEGRTTVVGPRLFVASTGQQAFTKPQPLASGEI